MRTVTRDSLYEFMLKMKGSQVNVTFGEEESSNPHSGEGGHRRESKADILSSLKS